MDEPPAHSSFLETARIMERLASQARFKCEGTVGAGINAGPHYFARQPRLPSASSAGHADGGRPADRSAQRNLIDSICMLDRIARPTRIRAQSLRAQPG